jgi:chemotaxis protein CheX
MIQNETLVNFVKSAAQDVFSTMLGMQIETGQEYTDLNAPAVSDGVLAFVGIAGSWSGAGAISSSAAFACRICNQLLMTEAASVNEEVLDAVGEVANMIIGNVKSMLEEELGPLGLSIPTVIYGRNFTSRSLGTNSWIVLPFSCEGETIEIRVCLAIAKDSSVTRGGYCHASAVLA